MVAVTSAFTTRAPLASVTVPTCVAVTVCGNTGHAPIVRKAAKSVSRKLLLTDTLRLASFGDSDWARLPEVSPYSQGEPMVACAVSASCYTRRISTACEGSSR